MKIIIDPRSNYAYGSYYAVGLLDLFGKENISYKLKPFEDLDDLGNDMRFVMHDGLMQKRVFLHLNDSYRIIAKDYAWCDIYGCVNANFSHCPRERYSKLVSMVPSFGIRVEDSLASVAINAIRQLISIFSIVLNKAEYNKYIEKMEVNRIANLKHYFGRRYRTWKNRLPIAEYNVDVPSEDGYIFFLSTLWYSNEENKNDETVNLRRAKFIRACKSLKGVVFEGGLLGNKLSSNEKFADVMAAHGEPFEKWIKKTKRSTVVFNTPAFWDCHGWKLGEYLALGKCIVSTKLSNDLPYPLEHGVNIHFVEDTEESMREAIEYILAHPEYRYKLEKGAREYWEKYGTPEASLRLLGIQ